MRAALVVPLALLLAWPLRVAAEEWALAIHGLSYHPDREAAREAGVDNEFNPGLALRYQWRSGLFSEAGAYRDSGRATATYAGVGFQWRVGAMGVGGALGLFRSRSYNAGRTFVAPVPLMSYDFGRLTLNAAYFPRVDANEVAASGFYFTLPLR